jgi:hypothetical protein
MTPPPTAATIVIHTGVLEAIIFRVVRIHLREMRY